jgi:hypothetical protein
MTTKYPGECRHCHASIPTGARAFRYKCGTLYCAADDCGGAAASDFESCAADEYAYNGGGY